MKILKRVVAILAVLTAPVWIVPVFFVGLFWKAVLDFERTVMSSEDE